MTTETLKEAATYQPPQRTPEEIEAAYRRMMEEIDEAEREG